MRALLLVLVPGCLLPHGGRFTQVETELPVGECAAFKSTAGGTCELITRDRHAIAGSGLALDADTDPRGTLGIQYRAALFSIDWRRVQRANDSFEYDTIAAGFGVWMGLLGKYDLARYFDAGLAIGGEGGALKFGKTGWRGRADWYAAAYVDITAPDVGPLSYLGDGVPGLRIALRFTDYAKEWESTGSVEISLVWRWGRQVELHTSGR